MNAGGVEYRAHRHEEQDAECQEHPEQQQDNECSDRSLITEIDEVPDRSSQARQPETTADNELDAAGGRRRGLEYQTVLLDGDRAELGRLVLSLRGRRRLWAARSAVDRLAGGLTILGLRTGLLTVLGRLGRLTVALLAVAAVLGGLTGLYRPTVGIIDR